MRERRAAALALWHSLLLDRLIDSEAEDRLDRIVAHRALAGPEVAYLDARLADRRGDRERARGLMEQCLEKLPGHTEFLEFAKEIGAKLPARACGR